MKYNKKGSKPGIKPNQIHSSQLKPEYLPGEDKPLNHVRYPMPVIH